MSSLQQINSPYPFFTDLKGKPTDGLLYIGEEGKDPESYPIQVYWDEALLLTASQPISITAGYITNNGTAAKIFSAENYSILVKSSSGRVIFYSGKGLALIGDPTTTIAGLVRQATDTEVYDGDSLAQLAFVNPEQYKKFNGFIDNLASLKTREGELNEVVCLKTYAVNTYKEPVFYKWIHTSSESPDEVNVIQVTGIILGRWHRITPGFLSPESVDGDLQFAVDSYTKVLITQSLTLLANITIDNPLGHLCGLGFNRARTAGITTNFGPHITCGAYSLNFLNTADSNFGLKITDLSLSYTGSSAALSIIGFLNSAIHNIFLDCLSLGEIGISYGARSFFSVLENSTITSFKSYGVKIDNGGTKAVIKDCDITSSQSSAIAAIEVNVPGISVYDGQADVNHAGDNLGIGVRFNNITAAIMQGGLVQGTLFEADTGIKITGTTHAFQHIVIRNTRHTLGSGQIGVNFDRAYNCVLENPAIYGPTGGTIAIFGANAIQCGIVGNFDMCRSNITVDLASVNCYKICTERILYTDRSLITTAANFTVIVNDCQYLGKTIHNGTAWDKFFQVVTDDSFVAITPPRAIGQVIVRTLTGGGEYIQANYNTGTGVTTSLLVGGGSAVNATDGALTGTTGTDGYITLRSYSSDGKVYIENRRGSSRSFIIEFLQ